MMAFQGLRNRFLGRHALRLLALSFTFIATYLLFHDFSSPKKATPYGRAYQPSDDPLRSFHTTYNSTKRPISLRFDAPDAITPAEAFKDIQVILKSGFAETDSKLRTHLRTVTSIVPSDNLLVFSDASSELEGHKVIDILADLPPSYRAQNPEFRTYDAQKQAQAEGRTMDPHDDGWLLDKHKFLPMVSKTWALRPLANFYVFIEADTFVFWANLLAFLAHLDSADQLYLGAGIDPHAAGHPPFAYGGSGYVLSAAAMQTLMRGESAFGAPGSHQFGRASLADECCGDDVLAQVLHSRGVALRGYWPLINGQSPDALVLGGDTGLWCEPVLSLHHVEPWEMEALWRWSMTSEAAKPTPLLYAHLLAYLLARLTPDPHAWSNSNKFPLNHVYDFVPAPDTARTCEAVCRANERCYHWQFEVRGDGEASCRISRSVQLGERDGDGEDGEGGGTKKMESGFVVEHVEALLGKTGACGGRGEA